MKYVYAFLLFLLIACGGYYALRLIVPPLKKLWAGVVLTAVSVGCLVLLLGAFYVHEVPYTYETAWETMGAIWNGFRISVKDLIRLFSVSIDWDEILVMAVFPLNVVLADAGGIICYVLLTERNSYWSFLGGLGAVVGLWLVSLVIELIVFIIIGLICTIVELFNAPDSVGAAIGIILVLICIFGAGGTVYEVTVRFRRK